MAVSSWYTFSCSMSCREAMHTGQGMPGSYAALTQGWGQGCSNCHHDGVCLFRAAGPFWSLWPLCAAAPLTLALHSPKRMSLPPCLHASGTAQLCSVRPGMCAAADCREQHAAMPQACVSAVHLQALHDACAQLILLQLLLLQAPEITSQTQTKGHGVRSQQRSCTAARSGAQGRRAVALALSQPLRHM